MNWVEVQIKKWERIHLIAINNKVDLVSELSRFRNSLFTLKFGVFDIQIVVMMTVMNHTVLTISWEIWFVNLTSENI